ncbi:Lipase 3 precursor [Roseibium album]|nr:Lipase 3 precursor [Roseibium album]
MAFFTHRDLQVSYDLQGKGQDLLFLHGLAADRHQAVATLDGLTGYRVITIDMPGHGDSALPTEPRASNHAGFDAYADVARGLLQHLGIDNAIVGGISMGAGIALNLALCEPALVRALVLVRPAWLDRPGRPHLSILEQIGDWLTSYGAEKTGLLLNSHDLFRSISAENPNCAASIKGAISRPQAVEAAAVLNDLVADQPFKRIEYLRRLTMPALVVGSNADPLHPSLIAREIQGALAQAEYFHAPPRYLVPSDHRKAVVEKISQFLGDAAGGECLAKT